MKKKPRGRPRKAVNEKLLYELASIGCTMPEMARITECSESTLGCNFHGAIEKGRTEGKASLRRAQFKLALTGNATMLIWLGKQLLEQRDHPDFPLDREAALALFGHGNGNGNGAGNGAAAPERREYDA